MSSETAPAPEVPSATPAAAAAATLAEKTIELTPIQHLYEASKQHGHPEIWGVELADPDTHIPSQVVFQKYLNANDGNLENAKDQLLKTLQWRSQTKPFELINKKYNRAKFAGLGYVTFHTNESAKESAESAGPEDKEIFTWNIYGSVTDINETFGDLQEFLDWRVALMELAVQALSLNTADRPITAEYDPYKIYQVHDYKSISFLRQSPQVKSASQQTIKVFAQNYPELLKEKFFVNVPAIMGFVYTFMKLFVAAKTIKKFHPMSNGANLAQEFADSRVNSLGQQLPKEYGGNGKDLSAIGQGPELE